MAGYHATTAETFSEKLHEALTLSRESDLALRQRARQWATMTFSKQEFEKGWEGSEWKKWL